LVYAQQRLFNVVETRFIASLHNGLAPFWN
jgi:hypothetical protein